MLTEDLLPYLKDELTELLHVYVPEKFLASDSTGKVFMGAEENWHTRPPAIVRIDGAVQNTGYTVNYPYGRVTFTTAVPTGDVVTAEFAFSPFSDTQLTNFLKAAQKELATMLGTTITDGVDLNPLFEATIIDMAYRRCFRSLMAITANYARWRIDGAEYDKRSVTANYVKVLEERSRHVKEQIDRIRLTLLEGGEPVEMQGFGDL